MEEKQMEEKLVAAVRKLSADSPDCIYSSADGGCYYNIGECSNGSFGCIIGQAYSMVGYPLGGDISNIMVLHSEGQLPFKLRDSTLSWLLCVQRQQDLGNTWGQAVAAADNAFPIKVGV